MGSDRRHRLLLLPLHGGSVWSVSVSDGLVNLVMVWRQGRCVRWAMTLEGMLSVRAGQRQFCPSTGIAVAVNYLIAALVLALQQAIERNQDYAPEFRIVWPDGEGRWIKGHARVLRDKAGQPIRMIGTNWDISEIKRRERNLACLSHLQQAIASLSSEEEVMRVTSERLADHFASV